MYLKYYYSTLGFCLVGSAGCLVSEAASLIRHLDRPNHLVGLDACIKDVLPLVRRDGLDALTKPLTYTWKSSTHNGTAQSSPPSANLKKDQATDGRGPQTGKLKIEEPLDCDDDEDQFFCNECGGREWDSVARVSRCKGV